MGAAFGAARAGMRALSTAGGRRLVRFLLCGGSTSLLQLALLAALVRLAVAPVLAYLIAYFIAIQAAFLLASGFTWRDRIAGAPSPGSVGRRWLAFQFAVSGAAAVNFAAFLLARTWLPDGPAAVAGIVGGAGVSFLLQDRLAFRRPAAPVAQPARLGDGRPA